MIDLKILEKVRKEMYWDLANVAAVRLVTNDVTSGKTTNLKKIAVYSDEVRELFAGGFLKEFIKKHEKIVLLTDESYISYFKQYGFDLVRAIQEMAVAFEGREDIEDIDIITFLAETMKDINLNK